MVSTPVRICLAAIILFPALSFGQGFVVDHVRVFDGERTIEHASVLVRAGRIAAVGRADRLATDLPIIDGSGRTLLPGLIDAHTHIQSRLDLQKSLVFGVTTDLSLHMPPQLAKELENGQDGQADLLSAGFSATAPGGHGTEYGFPVPTLTAPSQAQTWVDDRIDPILRKYLLPEDVALLQRNIAKATPNDCARAMNATAVLASRGVPILAGTDQHNPGTAPGASVHGELARLVEAGLTPLQALRAATSVAAKAFRLGDRGRIAPGLRADLLLVQGDPTSDIHATRNIVAVWKGGVEFDRDAWLNYMNAGTH